VLLASIMTRDRRIERVMSISGHSCGPIQGNKNELGWRARGIWREGVLIYTRSEICSANQLCALTIINVRSWVFQLTKWQVEQRQEG